MRRATHAGSWYPGDPTTLNADLSKYLSTPSSFTSKSSFVKSLIVPHAGYTYSGRVSGAGYSQIDPNLFNTCVILGPSHHLYFEGCKLPDINISEYQTPIGNLSLDLEVHSSVLSMCAGKRGRTGNI